MRKKRTLLGLLVLGIALLPNTLNCSNVEADIKYMKVRNNRRALEVGFDFSDFDIDYINTFSIYLSSSIQSINIIERRPTYGDTIHTINIADSVQNDVAYINLSLVNNEDYVIKYVIEKFNVDGEHIGNYYLTNLTTNLHTDSTFYLSTEYGAIKGVVNDEFESGYFNSNTKIVQEHKNNVNSALLNEFILLDALQTKITNLTTRISSLEDERINLVNQNHNLQTNLDNLYTQYNELYNNYQTQSQELTQLQQDKANLELQVSKLNDQVYNLTNELERVESELAQNVPKNFIDWIKIFSRGFIDIFNIEMLPNFKVGYLIVAPLLIGIISLFIKLIRGA